MSPFTLVVLFAAIFLVKGVEGDCSRTGVYGQKITPVDLNKENVVTFNTGNIITVKRNSRIEKKSSNKLLRSPF